MLASVISSFTRSEKFIADEHSYQCLVVKRLMIIKDTKIIPLGTESSHFMTLNHKNPNALKVIESRIQEQINNSQILYIAIDRGFTTNMIARAIEATQKNPDIIIRFYTLLGKNDIIGKLVEAVNIQHFETNIDRIKEMTEHLRGLYAKNRMTFQTQGDLTNYKIKYFKYLRELNEDQYMYTKEINNKYQH